MKKVIRLTAALLVGGCLGAVGSLAQAQSNLLQNGDFEADLEGTTLNVSGGGNVGTITGWRLFAVGAPAPTATATVTAAGGQTGKGLELTRQSVAGTDSALDKDDPSIWETIPAQERIYKLTVDARDGSLFGGTSALFVELQFPGSQNKNFDPGAQFETFGLTAKSGVQGRLSARLNLPSAGNSSVHLDNVRAVDATVGVNRIINGGFENSDSRLLNWRFFNAGASGSATLSGDAHSGDSAGLFSVTNPSGDIGLDLDPFRIATIPGETLTLSFAAKIADTGNPSSLLKVGMAGFNAGGGHTGDFFQELVAPPTGGYQTFSYQFVVPANTSFLNVAFRSSDQAGATAAGAFLIDDISVIGVPEPAGLALAACGLLLACRVRRRRSA